MLACPICTLDLTREGPQFRCPTGHTFDVAREGYVNLLQAPYLGDTLPMLRARRQFLDAGHYSPLADALSDAARRHLHTRTPTTAPSLLDAGCGEGYYTGAIATTLNASDSPTHTYGLDVSKGAIRMAAKRHHNVDFLVANTNTRLPFRDASLDLILCVFAPRNPAEFTRVLAPGGGFIVAFPTPHHLHEARATFALLDVEPEKERHIRTQFDAAFTLNETQTLDYAMELTGTDLANLIEMSPSARHITPQTLEQARETPHLTVTASFIIQSYLRRLSS